MIISNESMDNDPKELNDHQLLDDPQLFGDQLEVRTLIIQKSTVTPLSPMVLFLFVFLSFRLSVIVSFCLSSS